MTFVWEPGPRNSGSDRLQQFINQMKKEGCQSGAVQRLSPQRSRVRFPAKPIPQVVERVTLSDSVGFLRGSGFLLQTLQIAQYCLER
jgi:hypothetical protein